MAKRNEYVDWLCEQLAPLGAIRSKAMFGGWGFYCDECFFALVADDVFYVKADAENEPAFIAAGQQPFVYEMKDGGRQTMRYYTLPDSAFEQAAELLHWAKLGLGAALRAKAAGKGKKK